MEAEAIAAVYGLRPFVTGFKGYVGHTMAACGSIETVFTLTAMKYARVFATRNLEEVDPRCAHIRHAREVCDHAIRTASVQSFAFGGVNAVLFFRSLD